MYIRYPVFLLFYVDSLKIIFTDLGIKGILCIVGKTIIITLRILWRPTHCVQAQIKYIELTLIFHPTNN